MAACWLVCMLVTYSSKTTRMSLGRASPNGRVASPCLRAGLGHRTRRRTLKRWVRQGQCLPAPLAAEAADAAGLGAPSGVAAGQASEDDEAEVHGAEVNGGAMPQPPPGLGLSDLRNTGHLWHGQQVSWGVLFASMKKLPPRGVQRMCMMQVVEHLTSQGGDEALLGLCHRFRQCFVDTLQPQASAAMLCVCTMLPFAYPFISQCQSG